MVGGSQESLSKWGEGVDELEPFCRNSKEKIVQKATDFWHEETKSQRNYLTSMWFEDVMDKGITRKHFS